MSMKTLIKEFKLPGYRGRIRQIIPYFTQKREMFLTT